MSEFYLDDDFEPQEEDEEEELAPLDYDSADYEGPDPADEKRPSDR